MSIFWSLLHLECSVQVGVHDNTFEKMITIFRVILVEYEEHKIKYELFCVYCERFSRVMKIINRISYKYKNIMFDTPDMIMKGPLTVLTVMTKLQTTYEPRTKVRTNV